ncbi:MAG: adenosine deaminase [Sulfitobacter sp.]
MTIPLSLLRSIPKVVLHEHLDGGPRTATLIELAASRGIKLPSTNPVALADWFYDTATSGSLEGYLATFDTVNAVLQDTEALEHVAEEYVADLIADGVIYAEIRFAPERHIFGGLSMAQVVGAVARGIRAGMTKGSITVRIILCAIRNLDRSLEVAGLVINDPTGLVVAFDLAGGEDGNPPHNHDAALRQVQAAERPYTIHAGEIPSLPSLREALQTYGANRIGHGVAAMLDVDPETGAPGPILQDALARGVPFEVCPTSNLQTGVCATMAQHPFDAMRKSGLAVSINVDNRLMSQTSLTQEMAVVAHAFDYDLTDLAELSQNAAEAIFATDEERSTLVKRINKWFAQVAIK